MAHVPDPGAPPPTRAAPDTPGVAPVKPVPRWCDSPDNGCPTAVVADPRRACPAQSPRLCARAPGHQSACCLSGEPPLKAQSVASQLPEPRTMAIAAIKDVAYLP